MRSVAMACGLLVLAVLIGFAGPAAGQDKKDKVKDKAVGKGATAAAFEVYKGNDKKYYFRLRANDGTSLARSNVGFKTREEAVRVIEQIRLLAAAARVTDVATDKATDKKK